MCGVVGLGEGLADMRPLPRVRPSVFCQAAGLGERLAARLADLRPLPRMCTRVKLPARLLAFARRSPSLLPRACSAAPTYFSLLLLCACSLTLLPLCAVCCSRVFSFGCPNLPSTYPTCRYTTTPGHRGPAYGARRSKANPADQPASQPKQALTTRRTTIPPRVLVRLVLKEP